MLAGVAKCSKIRQIVRLRQLLRRWRRRRADVPAGYVAVFVGVCRRRFVVRAAHLNHPAFRLLLAQAEDEFGFAHVGPIALPCDEARFEEVLRLVSLPPATGNVTGPCRVEKIPLLRGVAEETVW